MLLTISVAMVGLGIMNNILVVCEPEAPVFIFGDSTVDVGTNNHLADSKARADFLFYGIDFLDSKPTGRFSNGLNTADWIAIELGFKKSPPPFLFLLQNDTQNFKKQILKGVNFASGGAGLLIDTGKSNFIRVIPMAEQIQQFATVHSNITEVLLNDNAEAMMNKSFFLISVGSNDIFDFFASNKNVTNDTQILQDFLNDLMSNYQNHLKNLIDLGARKFGIISVPAVGCCPVQLVINGTSGCMDGLNAFAQVFNTALSDLLQNLSSEFPDMKYSLGNSYEMTVSMITNPLPFGLNEVKFACCGNGTSFNAENPCSPDAQVCQERNKYLFWDQFHPTQAAARLAALTFFGGSPPYVSPFNFTQLVRA
ncbi:GDSL esterase/lipase [Quillaja saponaria]|uniref:GDSL esterase/lipase n=1 Tax=Quillaja saponaria TaxID=32244 RepID=A0AAD7KQX8_QUISA|nr:GDSL esterase/lipase [Quillaja saponaria]